jgi:hypothetical protein
VAHFDRAIPSGGEGKVTLTVDLKGYHGEVWKSATIFSNDPQMPRVSLSFHGKVRPFIQLLPASSVQFKGKGREGEEKTIDIMATLRPIHIQKIENGLADKIRVRLETVDDGRHYRLKIIRFQKSGKFFGFVKCITDFPQKPEILIPIINNFDG